MGMVVFAADRHLISIITNKCSEIDGRILFLWEITENNGFTKRIGATTYVVNVHFSETDSATLEDRLLHLIRNDIRVNGLSVVAEE